VAVTFLAAFFGGLGGYYLSRSRSTFVRILFVLWVLLFTMPYQAVIIPLTTITAKTGLINSHFGLILCYLIINIPLASVLMGTFFLGIPRELEEKRPKWMAPRKSRRFSYRSPNILAGLRFGGDHRLHPGLERVFHRPDPGHPRNADRPGGDGYDRRKYDLPLQSSKWQHPC